MEVARTHKTWIAGKESGVPSGLVSVPLIVCVFPSSEGVWIIELRTSPSFLIIFIRGQFQQDDARRDAHAHCVPRPVLSRLPWRNP